MRSNTEFRNLAWTRLWADHWFGRLFGGGLLLMLSGYAVNVVIDGILKRLGVQTWQDYWVARAQNLKDLTTPVPNLTNNYIFTATSASVLEMFIGYIMAGIAAYGTAVLLLKCLKNEENGWLGEAFSGFKDPFGMLWLFIRLVLIYLGWMLVAFIPLGVAMGACIPVLKPMFESAPLLGAAITSVVLTLGIGGMIAVYCIPFYRYRFAYLFKAEHPDWSAGACLRSCKALMEGHKWESFRLDCSYWKPITLALVAFFFIVCGIFLAIALKNVVAIAALIGLITLFLFFVTLAGAIVLGQYIRVGQGFFYQDLKDGHTTEQNERNA